MDFDKVEAGDKLTLVARFGTHLVEVVRVTNTQIVISGNRRFAKKTGYEIGNKMHSWFKAHLTEPDYHYREQERRDTENKIRTMWNDMSVSAQSKDLKKIRAALEALEAHYGTDTVE